MDDVTVLQKIPTRSYICEFKVYKQLLSNSQLVPSSREIAEAAVHRFLQKIGKFLMKKSVSKYYFNKVEDLKSKPLSKRKFGAGVLYKSFS